VNLDRSGAGLEDAIGAERGLEARARLAGGELLRRLGGRRGLRAAQGVAQRLELLERSDGLERRVG